MAGYRLVWLEIAEDQYRSLIDEVRALVDRRLGRLLNDPFGEPDADYNQPPTSCYSVGLGSTWMRSERPWTPAVSPSTREAHSTTYGPRWPRPRSTP